MGGVRGRRDGLIGEVQEGREGRRRGRYGGRWSCGRGQMAARTAEYGETITHTIEHGTVMDGLCDNDCGGGGMGARDEVDCRRERGLPTEATRIQGEECARVSSADDRAIYGSRGRKGIVLRMCSPAVRFARHNSPWEGER